MRKISNNKVTLLIMNNYTNILIIHIHELIGMSVVYLCNCNSNSNINNIVPIRNNTNARNTVNVIILI